MVDGCRMSSDGSPKLHSMYHGMCAWVVNGQLGVWDVVCVSIHLLYRGLAELAEAGCPPNLFETDKIWSRKRDTVVYYTTM